MGSPKDPTGDLYAMLDRAKLAASNFLQGKVGMSKLVNDCRSALINELKPYIEQREQEAYEKGYQEAKNNQV